MKILDCEPNISIEDVQNIETILGLKFPKDYIEHLLLYNGGRPALQVFDFLENGHKTSSAVDWFLAIYDGEFDNFFSYINAVKLEVKRLPYHIIPIANGSLGNLICLSCGEADYGKVYYWDHENEVDYSISDDSDYSNLYFISNSFTEFLNSLYADDDDE